MMDLTFEPRIFLEVVATLAVLFGLYLAIKRLRAIEKVHSDNLAWQQKIEAQNAVARRGEFDNSSIREAFGQLEDHQSPAVDEILEKFKETEKYDQLRTSFHTYLNYYEGLARGVNLGLYDEKIIKIARKRSMISVHNKYSKYFKYRQENFNPNAYKQIESLVGKWTKEQRNNSGL